MPESNTSRKNMSGSGIGPASAPAALLSPTIFHEPWWMDIASGGNWSEVVVRSGGLVVGRLPFQISKKPFGLTTLNMPLLTHVLGPALATPCGALSNLHLLREIQLIGKLIAQLPKAAHTSFRLHGGITSTLAFDASRFTSRAGFTVVIQPDPTEVLWLHLRDKTRNVIRRAQESLKVAVLEDVDAFLRFYEFNLRSRRRTSVYQREVTGRLLTECIGRQTGRILIATDQHSDLQAAIFTVWDHASEYYFMSTRRATSINGATCLLIWEALQHASGRGLHFDMDGIHMVGNNFPNLLLVTGFGGEVTPRYTVQRSSFGVKVAAGLRDYWRSTD